MAGGRSRRGAGARPDRRERPGAAQPGPPRSPHRRRRPRRSGHGRGRAASTTSVRSRSRPTPAGSAASTRTWPVRPVGPSCSPTSIDSTGLNVAGGRRRLPRARAGARRGRPRTASAGTRVSSSSTPGTASRRGSPSPVTPWPVRVAIGHGPRAGVGRPPGPPLRVRSGHLVGEPLGDAGDLFGLSVVHAARLLRARRRREVLVSSDVVRWCAPATSRFQARDRTR